jgi:hypothetical protein
MFSFTNLTRGCREYTVTARPSDVASLVTSTFHICFVRSFKNEPERIPFSHFIFCRAASLFVVTCPCFSYLTCYQSLRMWLVTSLAKDFVKQDLVLLVTYHSLTSQLVTCHTTHFVKLASGRLTFLTHFLLHMAWTRRCFVATALQLCFTVFYYEGCSKPGWVENQHVVYAEHADLFDESMHSIKRNATSFISALKVTGWEQIMGTQSIFFLVQDILLCCKIDK